MWKPYRSYSFESPFLVDVAKAKLITRRNIQNLWVQDAIPKVSGHIIDIWHIMKSINVSWILMINLMTIRIVMDGYGCFLSCFSAKKTWCYDQKRQLRSSFRYRSFCPFLPRGWCRQELRGVLGKSDLDIWRALEQHIDRAQNRRCKPAWNVLKIHVLKLVNPIVKHKPFLFSRFTKSVFFSPTGIYDWDVTWPTSMVGEWDGRSSSNRLRTSSRSDSCAPRMQTRPCHA